MRKDSYTIAEMIIVVAILSILAALVQPIYRKALIGTKDKEAKSILLLIAQTEKMALEEESTYWGCGSTVDCNNSMYLAIPTGDSRAWDYSVPVSSATDFCAEATSTAGNPPARSFSIREDQTSPVTGACP